MKYRKYYWWGGGWYDEVVPHIILYLGQNKILRIKLPKIFYFKCFSYRFSVDLISYFTDNDFKNNSNRKLISNNKISMTRLEN